MIAVNRLEPHKNGTAAHPPAEVKAVPAQVYQCHPAIEMHLLRIFAELSTLLRVNESHSIEAGGMVLKLSVEFPADKPPAPETDAERDVYDAVCELVKLRGRRVVIREVIAHLEATNRLWGKSTVTNALATLTHKGLLVNPRDKRGYGLPTDAKGGDSC